jgi:hypothetical protein
VGLVVQRAYGATAPGSLREFHREIRRSGEKKELSLGEIAFLPPNPLPDLLISL